jgi:hypothetical protein
MRVKFRPNISLRLLLAGIAVFALGIRGFLIWDFHRRAPASEKLLRPLIEFHDQHIQGYRISEKEELKLVLRRLKNLGRQFVFTVRSIGHTGQRYPVPPTIERFLAQAKSLVVRAPDNFRNGPTALENLKDSVWNSHMAAYHTHMRDYYTRLHAEHWTELPTMPTDLEAELRACEAEFRRNRNRPDLDLYDETAPLLRPGAPKPKPPVNSAGTGDSF